MSSADLKDYLYRHIPLSAAMEISVDRVAEDTVILRAPLAPNINHRETVFGGSASALAILAAWALLHTRLRANGFVARLVIQRNSVDYLLPIPAAFTAASSVLPGEWDKFQRTLARKRRARIAVACAVMCAGETVARFEGDFVALLRNDDGTA